MSEELPLRDKDRAVLQEISEGKDLHQITSTTIYENGEVNRCFTKLEDLGLIQIDRPDGFTTRVVDGQKRTFRKPKRAVLTDKGEAVLEPQDMELEEYEDLSKKELVRELQVVKQRLDTLERNFCLFQGQVRSKLDELEES